MVKWLAKHLRFVPWYDAEGRFFVQVPIDHEGNVIEELCAKAGDAPPVKMLPADVLLES